MLLALCLLPAVCFARGGSYDGGGGSGFSSMGSIFSTRRHHRDYDNDRYYHGGRRGITGNSKIDTTILMVLLSVVFIPKCFGWDITKGVFSGLKLLSRNAVEPKARETEQRLEELAKQDSFFGPEYIKKIASEVFFKLQDCWSRQEYESMRPLLAPGLFAEHTAQLRAMKDNCRINIVENVSIKNIDVVHFRYTAAQEMRQFTVFIEAMATDYYITNHDPNRIHMNQRYRNQYSGDILPSLFQEYWTFAFRDGGWALSHIAQVKESTALADVNVIEDFTPQRAGAAAAKLAPVVGAVVVAGLAAAAQAERGVPASSGLYMPPSPPVKADTLAGSGRVDALLAELAKTDKMWDRWFMSGCAYTAYLSVCGAIEKGDAELVRDSVSAALMRTVESGIAANAAAGVTVEYNGTVDTVEIALVRDYSDNARDEFAARIFASARLIKRKNGTVISEDTAPKSYENLWLFGKDGGTWKVKEMLALKPGLELISRENLQQGGTPELIRQYYDGKAIGV